VHTSRRLQHRAVVRDMHRYLQACWLRCRPDTAKGNRPSFSGAARPEVAEPLVNRFCDVLRELGVPVETGRFGARMAVELVNDGPVTIVLE